MPVLGLLGALIWWIRTECTLTARIRRVRMALGVAAAGVGAGFLIKVWWVHDQAADRGSGFISFPLLVMWLALLGGAALTLAWHVLTEYHVLRVNTTRQRPSSRLVRAEIIATVTWLCPVTVLAAVMAGMEWRYPAL